MVFWGVFNGGELSVSDFPAGTERGEVNHQAILSPQMLSK